MVQYEVKLTSYALHQMMEIKEYISVSLQVSKTAEKWMETMEKEMKSLSFMPARIPLTEEEPWHSQGIHKMPVKNFLVYFWINTEMDQVWITAIVYAKCSQRRQLELMEMP